MDLSDQLHRYFGTTDLTAISPPALTSGIERMRVDLGLEQDRDRRFALWALLHIFRSEPDLEMTFPNQEDREAARTLMDLLDKARNPDLDAAAGNWRG